MHTLMYAISRDKSESKRWWKFFLPTASDVHFVRITSKSALGWLANKGERWMPRLEKAMKDVA